MRLEEGHVALQERWLRYKFVSITHNTGERFHVAGMCAYRAACSL